MFSFVVFSSLIVFLTSFLFLFLQKGRIYLPRCFNDKYYSKTKFAKIINNIIKTKKVYKECDIDIFREIPFWISSILLFLTTIVFIIDISLEFYISNFVGKLNSGIIGLTIFLCFLSYQIFIIIWWRILNRKDIEKKTISREEKRIIRDIINKKNKRGKTKNNKH